MWQEAGRNTATSYMVNAKGQSPRRAAACKFTVSSHTLHLGDGRDGGGGREGWRKEVNITLPPHLLI